MPQLSHELETFLLYDPEKSVSTVHVSVAQPTPLELRTFGRLFLVVEIGSRAPMNTELIEILQDEMRRAYYQGPQLRLETAFEQALQHVNEQLKRLIEGGMTDWLDHFNIILGVLKDQTLILTHIGQIHATLVHRGRIVDIVDSAGPEERKVNPLKIFSNIITGELQEDDYLVFFTPSLLDYLSLEKLKRIVLDRPPLDAVRHLDELLAEAPPRTAFAALLAHAVPVREELETPASVAQPMPTLLTVQTRSSMDDLIAREEATQRLLTPSLWLVARRFLGTLLRGAQQMAANVRGNQPVQRGGDRSRTESPTLPQQTRRPAASSLTALPLQGGRAVAKSVQTVFRQRGTVLASAKTIPRRIADAIARLVASFPRWSFTRKALFLAIVALLFFFAQSIVSMGRRNESETTTSVRQETITAIEQKTFDAEAALSYDDETRAGRLIAEAVDLLATLEPEQHPNDSTLQNLAESVNQIRERTRHLVTIDSPTQVADVGNVVTGQGSEFLVFRNGELFAGNGADQALRINPGDGSSTLIENPNDTSEPLRFGASIGQSLVFSDGLDAFFDLSLSTDRTRSLDFTSVNADRAITALATYQSRIYLLDTKNNQIFRYQLGTNGFGTGSAWIQDSDVSLVNGVSLAVDGSVYVLNQDGGVRRFTQGRLDDFSLGPVDPPLASGVKLWTSENSDRIYVLDASGRRLVLFSKSGQFQAQFTSPAFTDLRDFAIEDNGESAYILNGNLIYRISLNEDA